MIAILLAVAAAFLPDIEAQLDARLPVVIDRAEKQALFLDNVMKERPLIGDWANIQEKAKGTQGVAGGVASQDSALPRSWTRGVYKVEPPIGWTSGFFPGTLWELYALGGKEKFRRLAESWTAKLEPARHYTGNHDMGFMFLCSYGNAIRYGGHGDDCRAVIRDAAKALSTRYDGKLKMIRSWDGPSFMRFPVIIDSMMNLEMMWQYGYREIATNHADRINATQFRADGSAYHVTDWNPQTGKIYARYAWQGACVDGAWSRGQAWSVYGFTMMARETGRDDYLKRAVRSADWILSAPNTPADAIPYWDYHAVGVEDATAARDASAAAIIASGLLELSTMNVERRSEYRARAVKILLSLCSDEYLAAENSNGGFVLRHSTGSHGEDTEIDASINYADYYFLEALLRYRALRESAVKNPPQYANPILHCDFSDPDVCVGGDGRFYMVSSSFGAVPGLPVLVSDDLVNWSYLACALERHPFHDEKSAGNPEHGKAVWAPSMRYRQERGEYVIYWGDPDRGAYRICAKNPAGPWSDPRLVVAASGLIDPCPLYDDDGRIYLVNGWAGSRAGFNSVLTVRELDKDETRSIGPEVIVYDGLPRGDSTAEGPKFYKKGGEYWLFFPAGGVVQGWQVAARASSPFGPYRARTVLAQGGSAVNGPHQGAWVRIPSNRLAASDGGCADWFIHFSDRGAYGRIIYLEPLAWREDGWPVIGRDDDGDGCGEPVTHFAMPPCISSVGRHLPFGGLQTGDEFDALTLSPAWHFLGKSRDLAAWASPSGYFRLYSTPFEAGTAKNTWQVPDMMVQKFPAAFFEATLKARISATSPDAESGIIVQGVDYARLGLKSGEENFQLVFTHCRGADRGERESQRVLAEIPAALSDAGLRKCRSADIWLRVKVAPASPSVPVCTFSYSVDGENYRDCGVKFTAAPGRWIGATLGIYSLHGASAVSRGWIDADYFRITETK